MTQQEFETRLEEIQKRTADEVTALVMQARSESGEMCGGSHPVDFTQSGRFQNWERTADAFGQLAGWIHDRMNGKHPHDKGSLTKKIRKALGYSIP